MSKLSNLSDKEIHEAIEAMQNGIAIKPNGEEARVLQRSIDRALEELQSRAQKKSVEPSANQGQSEETEKIKRTVLNPSNGIPSLNETPEKLAADREQQIERQNKAAFFEERRQKASEAIAETRVIGTVTTAPVITIPVVDIALSSGTRRMNRAEIMTMLKTWFKRVATSKAMEEGRYMDAYGGAMGQDTWKLFEGWNMIYNETKEGSAWPPMLDCFPGYKNASAVQKVNAEILWRWASNDK